MITIAQFEKYRKGDVYQFMVNVLDLLTEKKATALGVSAQRLALSTQTIAFEEAYRAISGSEITPKLAQLDDLRDNCIIGISYLLDGYLKHYLEDKREAAFLLQNVLKGYGQQIYQYRYQLETATLSNLLNDWQNKYPTQLALLDLTEWVTKLKEANEAFNAMYVDRTLETANIEIGVIEALKQQSIEAYRTLKAHIEAQCLLHPTKENEEMQALISKLVAQYNDAVNRYPSKKNIAEDPIES